MSEEKEKKVYPEGIVKISSQEYRDILETISELNVLLNQKETERSKLYWDEYHATQKVKELENKLEDFNKRLSDATEFINLSDDRKAAYKSFLFDKQQEKEADND